MIAVSTYSSDIYYVSIFITLITQLFILLISFVDSFHSCNNYLFRCNHFSFDIYYTYSFTHVGLSMDVLINWFNTHSLSNTLDFLILLFKCKIQICLFLLEYNFILNDWHKSSLFCLYSFIICCMFLLMTDAVVSFFVVSRPLWPSWLTGCKEPIIYLVCCSWVLNNN